MDDRALLEEIARRDPEAFRELMERYAPTVIQFAYRFLGTVADAEDAAQEVFLRLYQNPPRLTPQTKLSTWFYRVTANRCIDLLRKRSRKETISLEAAYPDGESGSSLAEKLSSTQPIPREAVAQSELTALTRRAIETLPLSLRGPLLVSIEGLSLSEIAGVFGISPKAAERRIARARDLLKSRLQPYL